MSIWVVRAGKHGEFEQLSFEENVVTIGWQELPDLTAVNSRTELASLMASGYPDKKPSTLSNWVGQVWTFAKVIQIGDIVALPLKSTPAIAFGTVSGDYTFDISALGAEHRRSVSWIRNVPRSDIDQDLLFSFGSTLTVFKIERNEAERRIRALINSPSDGVRSLPAVNISEVASPTPLDAEINLEELVRDAIRKHIARKFAGHGLAELVAAVLGAQGYKTHLSPPGPDGGVDVLAGRGPHGFDGPRLAVQVKSGSIEVDTSIFREFQGVMRNFGAEHGLIVSWGGFKLGVKKEGPREFFHIRMWGEDELVEEVLANYEALPPAIQARLPLKRTWMLVEGSDDSD